MAMVPFVGAEAAGELMVAANSMEQYGYALGVEVTRRVVKYGKETLKERLYDYVKNKGEEAIDSYRNKRDKFDNGTQVFNNGTYGGIAPYNVVAERPPQTMEADMGKAPMKRKGMFSLSPNQYYYYARTLKKKPRKRTYKRRKY